MVPYCADAVLAPLVKAGWGQHGTGMHGTSNACLHCQVGGAGAVLAWLLVAV